ncbi:MAG: hypothetical protein BTN85_1866 [Candidatus Methanohalarchaeum thermophilum]|uniref:Uncharacterized protein n=1 Tax=Methanohalarchaeum thermophilum TaxID=1903181 RepID=A0A1Q6DSA3_METT1|nr:MAG: hypothetical protein BTN85_1866 [Candidatus Methanohalarchaeum thermophilum]
MEPEKKLSEFIKDNSIDVSDVLSKYRYPFTREGMHFIGFISRRFDVAKHRVRKEYWNEIFDKKNKDLWDLDNTEKRILEIIYFKIQNLAKNVLISEIYVDDLTLNKLEEIESDVDLFNLIEKYVRAMNTFEDMDLKEKKNKAIDEVEDMAKSNRL